MRGSRLSETETKQIMVELLIKFDEQCKINHIGYFLGYGTLLGAIRHNGFIPWDNDIDIFIFRSELDKLIESFEENCEVKIVGKRFTEGGDKAYDRCYFYDDRTITTDLFEENVIGVCLDIFVMDVVPYKSLDRIMKRLIENIVTIKQIEKRSERSFYKKLIIGIAQNTICKIDGKFLALKYLECIKSYKMNECNLVTVTNDPYRKGPYSIDIFRETIDAEFEGELFPIPVGYNEFLTTVYGDYMEFPPEDKRLKCQIEAYWK